MADLVIWDSKSWHSDKEILKKWWIWWFQIWKVGIQSKNLRKNAKFVDLRFKKLALKQRWKKLWIWWFQIWKVGIQSKKLRKNGKFDVLSFEKLAFSQRNYWKMANLVIWDSKSCHSDKEFVREPKKCWGNLNNFAYSDKG